MFGDTLVAFTSDLLRGLDALPSWIVDVVVLGTRILWVIVLGGLLWWTLHGRQWRMLATVAAAGLVAAALVSLLDGLIETDSGQVLVDVGVDLGPLTNDGFPSTAGIAAVCGVLTAAAPWLDRRWRRAGWALIAGLTVTGFVDSPVAFDSILAVLVGWLSGAAVLVAVGAPSRRPTLQAVIDGLNTVGVPVQQLEQAGVDARGSTPYFGVDADGCQAVRQGARRGRAQRRRAVPPLPPPSAPQLRRRATVPHACGAPSSTKRSSPSSPSRWACGRRACAAFATADPNGFVLAYDAIDGRSLDRVEPTEVTDEVLAAIWRLVGELRRHRIAHRDLRLANVFLDDSGDVWLIDFGFSEVAASDLLLATDVAELLASSSLCVGAERAVASAARARRTGNAGAGPRSSPPVGAERRDSDGDQGSARSARRAAEPDGCGDRRHRSRGQRTVISVVGAGPGSTEPLSMNLWWLIVAGVGLLVVSVSIFEARRPSISRVESNVFHAVNGLPDRLYPLLWLPMQLGNLVVGTGAGLAVALVDGDLVVAIGAIAAMVLKLVTERIVRKEMADYLAVRQRPGTSQVGALLRGDVPASGPSFPSGHVILVAAVGCVVTPSLPIEWWWVPGVLTVLVMVGRVYVGAHNPLDVTAGLGTGLLLGGVLATFAAS